MNRHDLDLTQLVRAEQARSRREFIDRHFSRGDCFVYGAFLGVAITTLVLTLIYLLTR